MAENWINAKLYINDGSGREQLVHYETNVKQIVDFEQAVNEIINNSFSNPTFSGTVSIDKLHVLGTSQLDGDVTCNSNLAVHGTINIADQGVISSNNIFTRLSSKEGSYIDLKENGDWEIVSEDSDDIYSLSASSDGNLTYNGNVTLDKNLKVNGTVSSPINLPYATITSDATSTIIKTTTGALIDIPNVANREIQLKTSNDHTFALTGDGKITVDGEEVASKEIILNAVYPVGCTYITLTDVNPRTILGVGTWKKIGQGLQLAIAGSAKDSNNTNHTFSAGANDGEWAHAITVSEMAEHGHKVTCNGAGGHDHGKGSLNITGWFGADDRMTNTYGGAFYNGGWGYDTGSQRSETGNIISFDANRCSEWVNGRTSDVKDHTHVITIGETGSGSKHNNITPSFAIYLWTRTAI